jgi:23S rRNA pseudouridine1911/1915/1917 synthase
MKIKILYEDSNILAIEKLSGISVHPDGRTKEKTLTEWILKNYPKMKNVGEDEVYEFKNEKIEIKKPGVVHRLDRDTSGVLLLAKNEKAYEFLKKQFSAPALEIAKSGLADRQDRIKKTYVAIVSGHVKNERGVVNKPIGRSPKDFRRYSAGRGARGEMREAVTQYRVLSRFEDKKGNKFTYVELHPKTGRTHQLRVHMKYLNHPIVCDALYNPDLPCPKGITRMALHAKSIEFKNLKGETIKVESKIPKEFESFTGLAN